MSLLGERFARTRHRLSYIPEAVVLISFLLLFVFFSFTAPHFLTAFSLGNILTFGSITDIVVIGVGMLMIAGEFDLSVGSNFALASYILPLSRCTTSALRSARQPNGWAAFPAASASRSPSGAAYTSVPGCSSSTSPPRRSR